MFFILSASHWLRPYQTTWPTPPALPPTLPLLTLGWPWYVLPKNQFTLLPSIGLCVAVMFGKTLLTGRFVWSLQGIHVWYDHYVISVKLGLNHRPFCTNGCNWPSYLPPVMLNGFQGNGKFLHSGLSLAICQSRDSVPTVPFFHHLCYLTIYDQYIS